MGSDNSMNSQVLARLAQHVILSNVLSLGEFQDPADYVDTENLEEGIENMLN